LRFWDSSAVVPLVVAEASSPSIRRLVEDDAEISVWWATRVECASAIARRERTLPDHDERVTQAFARLAQLAESWVEISPGERLRELAIRAVRVHELRAGDALQLAAAVAAAEGRPETLDIVTLDERLALAAGREGFRVLPT
jgi:predicted nucleic acid-binding protein